jgi:hypothetical protein
MCGAFVLEAHLVSAGWFVSSVDATDPLEQFHQ